MRINMNHEHNHALAHHFPSHTANSSAILPLYEVDSAFQELCKYRIEAQNHQKVNTRAQEFSCPPSPHHSATCPPPNPHPPR
ncbi:MAG: hypothetical protein OD918_08875, partial [Gammaproteobacteria bacterium]